MGGVLIVVSAVLGYVMGHVGTSVVFYAQRHLGRRRHHRVRILGILGRLHQHPATPETSDSTSAGSFVGQLLIAAVFAVLSIDWVHTSTNLSFTRFSLPGWNLTSIGWIVLAILVIISSSNA